MRLEKIKLAGFKSFVDPTTVHFPSNLSGVVGPNGCGKSNIIDAVRWVMGESSAKQLRGESLTDVIFNGTVERKPVGQASVELVFDNREGKLGGEYAKYSQIAIKRQVNREAQSAYYLNGTKCRRRDIIDVFLGTGLGPRSYSIIEQGMITRLIEAKPEEMRAHLEEVSGISKYKERRRETENRIKHTRENLARLYDLKEEIEKQLAHLQRQAKAAERYKEYKAQERTLEAQHYAKQWQLLEEKALTVRTALEEQETKLQQQLAEQQSMDTELVELRELKHGLVEEYNAVQKQYYDIGGEVSRLEQSIHHYHERREQLQMDFEQTKETMQQAEDHLQADKERQTLLQTELEDYQPLLEQGRERLEVAQSQLAVVEDEMHAWQTRWDDFNQTAASTAQTAQVEQTRIQEIEQRQFAAKKRMEKINLEREQFANMPQESELDELRQELEATMENVAATNERYQQLSGDMQSHRDQENTYQHDLDSLRNELQMAKGRFASLEALQKEALQQSDKAVNEWLQTQGLSDKARLAQVLQVENGWERAVEVALGGALEAVCVDSSAGFADLISQLQSGQLQLIDANVDVNADLPATSLAHKVQAPAVAKSLLAHVLAATDLNSALTLQASLKPGQLIVTRDGFCVGAHWLQVNQGNDLQAGVLQREQELKHLQEHIAELTDQVEQMQQALTNNNERLQTLEQEREQTQAAANESQSSAADLKAKLEVRQNRIEHIKQRLQQLDTESQDLTATLEAAFTDLSQARQSWQQAMQQMEVDANEREQLLQGRDQCRETLTQTQQQVRAERDQLHELEVKVQAGQTQLTGLEQSIHRLQEQLATLSNRCQQLEEDLSEGDTPIEDMQAKLETALEARVGVQEKLKVAKQNLDENEHKAYEIERERHRVESKVQETRAAMESKRLANQETQVRQATLQERLAELELTVEQVLAEITDEMSAEEVAEALQTIQRRIERLGPINLAAIDEFETQSERKVYIDSQYEDLQQALATLEDAIRKIDKETRQRFKETFDLVNDHFQKYFPKVFGGGSAYLELTGEDLLDTGVAVMARPPGKKNASIHLLSGGEKALTAVALVFSMFQLNPAPFCMLDEVDAPLDDANVGRYCNLVKEMSDQVQFIFISHNKGAIEMGNQLVGVTMHEPGVSRIVSVDMDEAVAMAEA